MLTATETKTEASQGGSLPDTFLNHAERVWAPETVRVYVGYLRRFLDATPNWRRAVPEDVRAFIHQVEENASPRAGDLALASLKGFWSWALTHTKVRSNPTRDFQKSRRRYQPSIPWVTPDNVEQVLFWCRGKVNDQRPLTVRNYALLLTLAATGMRVGEAVALDWRHVVHGSNPHLAVIRSKTGVGRKVPMLPVLANALRFWKNVRIEREWRWPYLDAEAQGAEAVFIGRGSARIGTCAARDLVQRMFKANKITGSRVGPHSLRRVFVTAYLSANLGDESGCERIIGHQPHRSLGYYNLASVPELRERMGRIDYLNRLGAVR